MMGNLDFIIIVGGGIVCLITGFVIGALFGVWLEDKARMQALDDDYPH